MHFEENGALSDRPISPIDFFLAPGARPLICLFIASGSVIFYILFEDKRPNVRHVACEERK